MTVALAAPGDADELLDAEEGAEAAEDPEAHRQVVHVPALPFNPRPLSPCPPQLQDGWCGLPWEWPWE